MLQKIFLEMVAIFLLKKRSHMQNIITYLYTRPRTLITSLKYITTVKIKKRNIINSRAKKLAI